MGDPEIREGLPAGRVRALILAGVAVVIFVLGIAFYVHQRSEPPPPPHAITPAG